MRRIRTGNRRRARAHARAEAERIRQWRLKKLRRLVIREVLKRVVKQFEDLILHGSQAAEGMRGLGAAFEGFASGGIVNVPRGGFPRLAEPCFFGIDLARPGSDRTVEFVIVKDKPIRIPGMAAIKDPGA